MTWRSTKTFGHELGLSIAFRNHHTGSHCQYLHGYALAFEVTFESEQLDVRGWVMDFGAFGEVLDWLRATFDHRLVVAADDPARATFEALHEAGLCQLTIAENGVGCERFAELVGEWITEWLDLNYTGVRVAQVECREHGANAGTWVRS